TAPGTAPGTAPATAAGTAPGTAPGAADAAPDRGRHIAETIFREVVAGEVYAFGISEPGNDLVLFGSLSDAEPTGDGGFAFSGVKIFTSGSPVWTRLGTFGADKSDPANPKSVFGFITRDGGGVTVKDDWDTLGMRPSQ